ncbi:hypothetical protein WV31_08320 [Magnetospirillum sp. ME-1]|uniref:restriction endonuclease subunit S n=1 Tax=Magnetospirillum sp. ME-1 TaxID=1639348 RepID=UPI000A17B98F|nr:restriction endonuclease subunit S [Magnetospirillum sp. ME-1]ARJ65659.1 hypothetical protein WV31_08320 [Magnetospirillum sp. ME-1]
MRLSDTCTIHSGFTARGKLESIDIGGVPAIQLRDISAEGAVDPHHLARVPLEGVAERYFVRAGDVLFRSRGERTTACALDDRFIESAVAILPLMVLRPKRDIVLPGYLAWAINQPAAQRHFDGSAYGTNIRMVPRSSLDELEIDIPDIVIQQKVVAIDALAERERELSILAAERRRWLTGMILADRIKTMSPAAGPERKTK